MDTGSAWSFLCCHDTDIFCLLLSLAIIITVFTKPTFQGRAAKLTQTSTVLCLGL